MISHPLHQSLPHDGVLVVEIRQPVELAVLQEVGTTLVVGVVDEAAVVRVIVLRLVEGFQQGHISWIAGIDLLGPGMVHVHVNDDLHLPLMKQDDHLSHIFLCSVSRIHLREIFRPVAMVSVRHLVYNRGKDDAVDTQLLKIAHFVHDARDAATTILVQLLAVLRLRRGESIDKDLIHCDLRPSPRASREVVPLLLGGVVWHVPHAAG
mmetsp:Transcript_3448/g.8213  ORF Transcript_3448/g.8213 Transcript_3448/m.8213 type:complete len:208 (-) Transcript_3448:1614-2237(-)